MSSHASPHWLLLYQEVTLLDTQDFSRRATRKKRPRVESPKERKKEDFSAQLPPMSRRSNFPPWEADSTGCSIWPDSTPGGMFPSGSGRGGVSRREWEPTQSGEEWGQSRGSEKAQGFMASTTPEPIQSKCLGRCPGELDSMCLEWLGEPYPESWSSSSRKEITTLWKNL